MTKKPPDSTPDRTALALAVLAVLEELVNDHTAALSYNRVGGYWQLHTAERRRVGMTIVEVLTEKATP